MKLRKIMTKTGAALCAAASACTMLGSFSALTLNAAALKVPFSSVKSVQTILNGTSAGEAAVRKALNGIKAQYKTADYSAIYTTTGVNSKFILVYDTKDMDVSAAVKSAKGQDWTVHYSTYLNKLQNLSGVSFDYFVCVLDTNKGVSAGYNAGASGYFNDGASLGILSGIMKDKFTHCLLHETAHGYKTGYPKSMFNSEEEVYVNVRVISALHLMGLDTSQCVLTDANAGWTTAYSNVDKKYYKSKANKNLFKPQEESDIWKLVKDNSNVKKLNPTFLTISEPQYLAYFGKGDTSSFQLLLRLGSIFGHCTNAPVWYAANANKQDDPNNWLNTDKLNENWNTISNKEWNALYALCISNYDKASVAAAKKLFKNYTSASSLTETIKYKYNGKVKTVKVTKMVKQVLSETGRTGDVFNCTGNQIQAFNMLDFMMKQTNQDLYAARIINNNPKININMPAKDYYRDFLGSNYGKIHAFEAPQALV